MKVLVDARLLGYFGPGEYLKNLMINLARLDRENKYIVIINKRTPPLFDQRNFFFFRIPSFIKPYSPWEQLLIPYLIRRFRPDLTYFPNFNIPIIKCCPYVVTIHDLIYLLYPEDSPSRLSFYYARFMLKKAVKLADRIITDSECSRTDIINYLKAPGEKVSAIPAAAGDYFIPIDKISARAEIKQRYKIEKDFILYAGNHHYHKNILTLIEAYSHLKEKSRYRLIITGEESWRTKKLKREVEKRNLEEDIVFLGFVPTEDLSLLYNAAICFVFPSLYEGFGLPPLEAMACGTQVIASNRGSLPEVLGAAAVFIDPLNMEELTGAMEKILSGRGLGQGLIEKGLEQAKSFSWGRTADKILGIFNSLPAY